MKKMTLVLLAVLGLTASAIAANYDNPIEGTLKSVYADFITITIPSTVTKSPDSNQYDGNLAIKLTPSTTYDQFNQLSDLKSGDLIRVTYHEDPTTKMHDQKIADRITKLQSVDESSMETTTTKTVVTTTVTSNTVNPMGVEEP